MTLSNCIGYITVQWKVLVNDEIAQSRSSQPRIISWYSPTICLEAQAIATKCLRKDTRIYGRESKRNAAAEWLAPLLHIREVPGSNLGPEAGYPD
jgi:hypothetical protein